MVQEHIPEGFAQVSSIFKRFCEEQEIEVLALAVEKHGSWEWSAGKKGDINRYVALALTDEVEDLSGPRAYLAEVWAEADDNLHFARRISSTFRMSEEALASPSYFGRRLVEALATSWQQAKSLKQADLTESYISARP